jgi:hypothetical protein
MIFERDGARAKPWGSRRRLPVTRLRYYEERPLRRRRSRVHVQSVPDRSLPDRVGLVSTPIEPPIDWSATLAPEESRAFVTFVNPSAHKGLLLFRPTRRHARIATPRHSDSGRAVGHSGGSLNAIPGIDFSKYPQIMAAPPVPAPKDYFALTRILVALPCGKNPSAGSRRRR